MTFYQDQRRKRYVLPGPPTRPSPWLYLAVAAAGVALGIYVGVFMFLLVQP